MIYKRLLFLVIHAFFAIATFAQNGIAGTWNGQFFSSNSSLGQPRLVVEIYDFKDSLFSGITHLYYEDNKYEHYKMVGRYIKKDSLLIFMEAATIAVDLGGYNNCLGTYNTRLKRRGNTLILDGFWDANIRNCSPIATVFLQKQIPPEKKLPPIENKPTVAKKTAAIVKAPKEKHTIPDIIEAPAPVVKNIPVIKSAPAITPTIITQRETDVQSLLEISPSEKDSIKVEVYDNGEIDGDSVSVYEEDILRVNKKLITARPITFYVSLNKNVHPIVHLRMIAESLGSIPPCTALMIVTTKSKRYEVHLSSNFNKNATVELFLKE